MNVYRKIILGMVLSNLIGAFLIFFYFAYIDIETFQTNIAFWQGSSADWMTFSIVMFVLALVGVLIAGYYGRFLYAWEQKISNGLVPDALPVRAQQWAAGYPLFIAAMSLVSWQIAALFFAIGGLTISVSTPAIFIRTFIGVGLIGGTTTATLIFLFADAIWREKLPHFFPSGKFENATAIRISIRYRLIAAFLLTGFVPLLIVVATSRNGALAVMSPNIDPYVVVERLELTVLFVVAVSLVSNFLLSVLTARSLIRPLQTLSQAMSQVASGDLSPRAPIASNDELGDLTRHFNTMLEELSQSQRMRDLFGRYVSREVAERVLMDGPSLGGEDVAATALFADIRDFTGLSERLPAQQVVDILNRYYTRMVDVVVAEGGIVNKFGGDSLLAIFGVPIRQTDHALRAVRAAWRMNRALAEFNAEQIALGLPPLTIGIGISSGDMVAGNIGGRERLEYTVIGDPVNLAARLQSLTKEWGTSVLLSEDTERFLNGKTSQIRPLQKIQVRGKKEPKLIYELIQAK